MDVKKMFAFLVLAVFLISALPLALAENGNGNGRHGDDNGSTEDVEDLEDVQEVENETTTDDNEGPEGNAAGGMRVAVAGNGGLKARIVEKFMEKHPDIVERFLAQINATNKSNIIRNLDRARLKECLNDTEDCKEKIKDWKVKTEKIKDMISKRVIAQDKLRDAHDKFLKAKNKYSEMKNNQLRARDEFLDLKDLLAKCKASRENCTELENQTFEKAQEDLSALAERLIQYLEKVKSRVESAENLNETQAHDMIVNTNELITRLEEAKGKVESATTQDELKEAANLIRNIWNDIKYKAFLYAEEVIHSRVGEIFARSEILEKKLEVVVEKLKENRTNTTGLEDKLDEFSAMIDEARTKMTEANKLFQEAKDLRSSGDNSGAKDKLEEAKTLTREAHQALKDAHKILMDLVHMINENGEDFDPDEVDEEEEVEVVEEDE